MTTGEIIKRVERQRPGCNMSFCDYMSCLNTLDQDIYSNIISCHEGSKEYVLHTSEDDKLLVPDMYADLYCFWIFARIDLANADIPGYTNNMILYNNLMREFCAYYTRNNMPKARGRIRWR